MYGGDPSRYIDFAEQTGFEFESTTINVFEHKYKDSKTYKVVRYTGTLMDRHQGTDFTVGEIRFDPTLNFDNKNYMPFISDTEIEATPGYNFMMGVRHGNGHHGNYHGFEEPVVVIGLNMEASDYRRNEDEIIENLKKNTDVIVEKAMDCLDDYQTTDPEERKDLYATPLKPNKYYRQPRNIEARYREYNNIQRFLTDENDSGGSKNEECIYPN